MKIETEQDALRIFEKLLDKRLNDVISQSANNIREGTIVRVNTAARSADVRIAGTKENTNNLSYARAIQKGEIKPGMQCLVASSDPKVKSRQRIIATFGGGDDATPLDSRAFVYLSTPQSITGGVSIQQIEFDTEDYDTGENFDTSTHIFTAPADGTYLVSLNATFSVGADLDRLQSFIRLDGATFFLGRMIANTADTQFIMNTTVIKADKGQQIDFAARNVDTNDTLVSGLGGTTAAIHLLFQD